MSGALAGSQRLLRSGTFIVAVLVFGVWCAGVAGPAGAVARPNAARRAEATTGLGSGAEPDIEPQVCSGCEPPLIYEGGPVMSTNTVAGLTITPIFWAPSGGKYVFPAKYGDILDGYIKNVAAASGSTDNIFSIDTEYYQVAGGVKTSITYHLHAGPTSSTPTRSRPKPARPTPATTTASPTLSYGPSSAM